LRNYNYLGGNKFTPFIIFFLFSPLSHASVAKQHDLTTSWIGILCIVTFVAAYIVVMLEEYLELRKSKPVLIGAGIIWILIGWQYTQLGQSELANAALKHNFLEFSELMLFLMVAMTYINAMEERRIFDWLRVWMLSKGLGFKQLFWLTGILSFFISPLADNLTTALLMSAVVIKVGQNNSRFITLACINIVVAANAGGAFSPFGDITTLMVWQKGQVHFMEFFVLFLPSVVNYLIPAIIISYFVPRGKPAAFYEEVELKRGAKRIVGLFLLTVLTAVLVHALFHLPPVLGMMTGLGYLQFFGYFLRRTLPQSLAKKRALAISNNDHGRLQQLGSVVPFDIFSRIARSEWDTLLFFYGVVMCVGGLGFLGYLQLISHELYYNWDPLWANIIVGLLSSVVDNIPVMFAVLNMQPEMSLGHWLLVTLTAGVGGSLLSIGSAAGVALMGQARGHYTFMSHLKWSPVILLGYIGSILVHLWINGV